MTSVVDEQEIVWVVDGQNHVSIDATSIASVNLESTEEATPLTSAIISGIMISLGLLSLIFALFEARRKSE